MVSKFWKNWEIRVSPLQYWLWQPKSCLLYTSRYNFERLGLEAKPGETEEDEKVRQLMIANMIKANDEAAQAQASAIFEAHADDLEKLPAAIRLQILVNQIKHQETKALSQQYLDRCV